jgi:L,D-transpeptidase ErfK/SrfK
MRIVPRALGLAMFLLVCAGALWSWNGDGALPISRQISGDISLYKVRPGDSLGLISSRFGTGLGRLETENALNPQKPLQQGRNLNIDNRHIVPAGIGEGVVINIPQRMLFLLRDGTLVRSYPVGLGQRTWPTPVGAFAVTEKENDPTWDVPISIQEEMRQQGKRVLTQVPPGPDNPLGKYFVRIAPSFGIHGTIAPGSIYRFSTHGCIRLHPDDIADLFARVSVGTPVHIVYEPVLLASPDGKIVYVEAYPDVYRRTSAVSQGLESKDSLTRLQEATASAGLDAQINWDLVQEVLSRQEGVPENVSKVAGPTNEKVVSWNTRPPRLNSPPEAEPAAASSGGLCLQ